MDRPIRDHIERIRAFIEQLESDMTAIRDEYELLKSETDLRSLRLALMHYELALEIEREVIESRAKRDASHR
jgi:hypothetical protein